MCGIVGCVAKRDVVPILLSGLQRLEYRGYDSAGFAIIDGDKQLKILKAVGKVDELRAKLSESPVESNIGIAHARWATHGKPTEANCHPHVSHNKIAIVHNGIIENHSVLRDALSEAGYQFTSDTDSEVIAHLIHQQLADCQNVFDAVQKIRPQLRGSYAVAVIDIDNPDEVITFREASPLVIGIGDNENFLASDHLAILSETQQFMYLKDGDIAKITADNVTVYDENGQRVEREIIHSDLEDEVVGLGHYQHFMEKEMYQQPQAISDTLEGHIAHNELLIESFGEQLIAILPKVKSVQIIACGTSYHAGLVAKYWIEQHAKLPCNVEIASEFRYRNPVTPQDALFITISQSGETADTLAALQMAKKNGYLATLTICNVPQSSLIRESDAALMTRAGPEIGVASTKAFTTQLTALLLLTGLLAKLHHELNEPEFIATLTQLPKLAEQALALDTQIAQAAKLFEDKFHALFLGRGIEYPIALEGALKLKEISYIHAEAYAAGELKHGPLALIDETMPIVALAANDHLHDKLRANLQEVKARGGELLVFADERLTFAFDADFIKLPSVPELIAPIIFTIPLQLLSYHVALLKGTDIDKPRNLAKSVTVE